MTERHDAALFARFLNDETARTLSKFDAGASWFADYSDIFEAILQLHYDGHNTNFIALTDYFRRRGKLRGIGEHTLTTLAGDSRIAALDNNCCDYARDIVIDALLEREAARICKAGSIGKITFAEVREQLNKLTPPARKPDRPCIEFRSPLQLKNFTPPPGLVLVGDFHIVKGGVFVDWRRARCWKVARCDRAGCGRSNAERLVRSESSPQIQNAHCPD